MAYVSGIEGTQALPFQVHPLKFILKVFESHIMDK